MGILQSSIVALGKFIHSHSPAQPHLQYVFDLHNAHMLTPHQRTRLIPIDAVSSSDLAEAANHLLKAEWNELATEGQLLSQNPEVGYGTPLVDRLLPELLTRRLHRARMEVYLYTEVQARREGECNQHS